MSTSLGAVADPLAATWTKAVAAAAALAFAGAGAHIAAQNGHPLPGLGHLPIVGAKHVAKAERGSGKARSTVTERLTNGSETSGRGASGKGKGASGDQGASSATAPTTTEEAGGHGGSSDGAGLPSVSAPSAPSAQDAGVPLPPVDSSSAAGDGSAISIPDPGSVVPKNAGASAPSPSVPPVDVRSVVAAATGGS